MQKYLSKRNIFIFAIFILTLIVVGYISFSRNMITSSIENIFYAQRHGDSFKTTIKIFIKEKIFIVRNHELMKNEILNNPVFSKSATHENIAPKINLQQQWIASHLKHNREALFFTQIKQQQKTINDKQYDLNYFQADIFADILDEYSARMYLHYHNDKLFFIVGEGILGSIDLTEQTIYGNQLEAYTIASNLGEFLDPNFDDYDNNIRDLFIKNNKIYVSINIAPNPECYGTVFLAGTLNTEKIEFKQIFAPDACDQTYFKNQETEDFLIDYTLSGGRIVDYKNGKILVSTGDSQKETQNNNTHGKIFAIDEKTYSRDIISIGHRNPQGLYYNKQEDIILSTEHGPLGGDEINLNRDPDGDIENFGWPIASYGFVYDYDPETDENVFKTSHQEYGFIEPLRYYTPSIAISQIIQLPKKFNQINDKQILVAALTGSDPDPQSGGNGITHFILNDDYSIKEKDVFELDGRIRDLIYIDTLNVVIAYHEDAKSILIIKALNQ